MDFAAWLDAEMKKHNINQPGLAKAIGVTQPAVSGWLSGKEPSLSNLKFVAEYFGYTLGELLQVLGVIETPKVNGVSLEFEEAGIVNDMVELRGEQVYAATIVAMKALLMVAKTEADSPFPEDDD